MFESTIEMLDRLYVKLRRENTNGFEPDLASEARRRLLQLDRLLELVREREAQADSIMRRLNSALEQQEENSITVADSDSPPTFELHLFTECFYFIAWRLHTTLTKKLSQYCYAACSLFTLRYHNNAQANWISPR
jgi:hypothetical protein